MIDAYTIGIKLALDNGVSDGIAAIRRDLAALDAAVAVSTANVGRLRALAADLPRLAEAGPAPTVGGPPTPRDVPKPPAAVDSITSPDRSLTPVPPPSATSPVSSPRSVTPAAPAPTRPVQPAQILAPPQSAPKSLARVENRFGPPPTQAAPVAAQPLTIATKQPPQSQRKPAAPILAQAPAPLRQLQNVQRAPLEPAAPRAAAASAPARIILPNVPTYSAAAATLGSRATPPPISLATEPSRTGSTPRNPASSRQSQRPTDAPATRRASATPASNAAQPGAGDVVSIHLDGQMLATINAEHLARSASRPTAAATAFDRRLTPAWPATAT